MLDAKRTRELATEALRLLGELRSECQGFCGPGVESVVRMMERDAEKVAREASGIYQNASQERSMRLGMLRLFRDKYAPTLMPEAAFLEFSRNFSACKAISDKVQADGMAKRLWEDVRKFIWETSMQNEKRIENGRLIGWWGALALMASAEESGEKKGKSPELPKDERFQIRNESPEVRGREPGKKTIRKPKERQPAPRYLKEAGSVTEGNGIGDGEVNSAREEEGTNTAAAPVVEVRELRVESAVETITSESKLPPNASPPAESKAEKPPHDAKKRTGNSKGDERAHPPRIDQEDHEALMRIFVIVAGCFWREQLWANNAGVLVLVDVQKELIFNRRDVADVARKHRLKEHWVAGIFEAAAKAMRERKMGEFAPDGKLQFADRGSKEFPAREPSCAEAAARKRASH
jgi:hypothetical protein